MTLLNINLIQYSAPSLYRPSLMAVPHLLPLVFKVHFSKSYIVSILFIPLIYRQPRILPQFCLAQKVAI